MVYCTVLVVSAGQTNSWYVGQTVLDSRFDTAHKVNTALFLLWHYFGDGLIDIQIWSMIHRWSQKKQCLLKAVLLVIRCYKYHEHSWTYWSIVVGIIDQLARHFLCHHPFNSWNLPAFQRFAALNFRIWTCLEHINLQNAFSYIDDMFIWWSI